MFYGFPNCLDVRKGRKLPYAFNKPDFYMKCPVKLIKYEKVGQTIITEFCVKFFGRKGSATKFQNISVTSSTASQSLHANKKWKLTILNQLFLYLFNSYFQLSDFKCVKSSRVLNFAILGRRYFTGFYFRDFKRQIWIRGINFTTQAFSISFKFSICQILTAARDIS